MTNTILITVLIILLAYSVLRYIELKNRKITAFTRIVRKGDVYVESSYVQLKKSYKSFLKSIDYIKHGVIERGWNSLSHSVKFTKNKVDTLHDRLNGKGEVKKSDHVSFYLQSVTDHKKSFRDQREK